jgi:hypothetical protein
MSEHAMIDDEQAGGETQVASRWEDCIDVFFSPAELYRRRADDRVMPPLLILLGLAVVLYFVMLPANAMVMRATIAENPEAGAMIDQFGTLLQLLGSIFVPITYLIVLSLAAATLWFNGRLVDIRTDFSRTMLIATYAGFVYLLSQVAGGVAVMLHGEVGLDITRQLSFGPLRFLGSPDMDPVVAALLRRFELFTLWQAALWGIGIAVIYRVSRARAFMVASLTWLLLAIPSVVLALLGFGQAGPRG